LDRHPTEDDLILHFYGEGDAADEVRIDAHLNTCASCQASWVEFRETMQLVDVAQVPEPGPSFERVVWARLQPALADARPRARVARRWFAWPGILAPISAMAAVIVAGAISVRLLSSAASHPAAPAVTTAAATPPDGKIDAKTAALQRERVLLTALNGHFDDAQVVLTELLNAPETAKTVDVTFARDAAGDLVASGRLYRATAEQNGNARLAAMLDELETVLTEVAQSPDQMNQADLQILRRRITSSNLLFKVQALANDVRERQKSLVTE
jgi:hypothetical protein